MTANELLSLLGRAWWPLLVYPGGLSAFVLVGLLSFGKKFLGDSPTDPFSEAQRHARAGGASASAVAVPWLALALMPLPRAASISRPLDAMVLLALLEWPLVLAVAADARATDTARWQQAARRLTAVLNGYPSLLLALLALAWSGGSLQLGALARPPADLAPLATVVLHWFGAATLVLALPPVLGLGPFAAGSPRDPALQIGLRLRLLGLVALAALPWFPLLGTRAWLLPLPPLVIGMLLWLWHRCARGAARRWAVAYNVLAAVQLLALLALALDALRLRIT